MSHSVLDLSIAGLRAQYASAALTPTALVDALAPRLGADDTYRMWIHRIPLDALRAQAAALEQRDPATLPLYGVPFAIKDNLDLAGVPTTAACPAFAYTPTRSATVVQRLVDAGALPVGKTNLDQFATGLVGARSPYGACRNAFDPAFISGGSSSGSAVAVARGCASFALGTDTAGSGRVPAAFNHLIGHKPSLGLLPSTGAVPACRSLDTVSIFALCAGDAQRVLGIAAGVDPADAFSRPAAPYGFDFGDGRPFRFGVPRRADRHWFGNTDYPALFDAAVARLEGLGGTAVEVDFTAFFVVAKLLYEGPWVAERYAAIRTFFDAHADALHPVTRAITAAARDWSAADAWAATYRLRELAAVANAAWADVDVIVTPTAPTHWTLAEVEADPIATNAALGTWTNFMNLLDYAATAVPAGFAPGGRPFGVTLFAPAHRDLPLLHLADRLQRAVTTTAGAIGQPLPPAEVLADAPFASGLVEVAVCGAHLSGLPLNGQLTSRGARLIGPVRSAPVYRFVALPGGPPARPGMVRVASGGGSVEMELWSLPAAAFGSFVAGIPAPLGIGSVLLDDGRRVQGFVCEAAALDGAEDITALGSWRAWLARG
ncbi:MAG: allophanate hydrolase [Burkholderiales bacterium]|nr:allophanate hydrolase [Burkholderiales bacterium]